MNNPFQEQLLKAGIVTKQQVQKANTSKKKKHKQQRAQKGPVVDETKLKAQQAIEEKARRDRELNQKKLDAERSKAISAEINQLITDHHIERGDDCDIVYNFEHNKKVKRIYVNEALKKQIVQGKLGIARIEGRYELVPLSVAEKIKQRNEKRIVLFEDEQNSIDENDPYADYQIPDDLTW
jgi:uncharacterized protein YaiL (DUF2058 family)